MATKLARFAKSARKSRVKEVEAVKVHLSSPWASFAAIVLAVLWTIPTFGLFVTSFRPSTEINTSGWWNFIQSPIFTFENYSRVLFEGSGATPPLSQYFLNTFAIVIPSTIIPSFGITGTFIPIWLAHTMFGLPLAIFLLHNFIAQLPRELIEAARVDGADYFKLFRQIVLPLSIPAIASFAIFQFLWVWNDLLVALTFGGGKRDIAPLMVRLAEMTGTRGGDWELLTAGAFVSILVPVAVFFALQRYFVRGLLAGSVKG